MAWQGLFKELKKPSLNKQLQTLISNAPKYNIQDEAYQNQNIARSNAYGRNRSIELQENQMDQDAANAVNSAKDVTGSTSGLLSTLSAIQANKDVQRRDLASQEAQIKQQNIGQLMDTNQAMIDEKDKAWNYNVNMPYQAKVAALRDRKKARAELASSIFGSLGNVVGGLAGGDYLGKAGG